MKNLDVALKNLNIFPTLPTAHEAHPYWMGMHHYEYNSLLYVLEGAFVLNIASHNYIVQKHQLVLFPANHPLSFWRLDNKPLSYLHFPATVICHDEDFFEFFGLSDDHHIVNLPPEPVLECYAQMRTPNTVDNDFVYRINLCLQLGKLCHLYAQARISEANAKHEFADAIDYMHAHVTEDVSLTELASLLHFDHSYFVKKFKKQMGISPMKYFARMRAQYAADLLKSTDMTVAEVAAASGFSDVYYFKTFFARNMGVKPERYKEILMRPKQLRFSEN